ncbi:MAG TPA: transglutaminase domain-containing protein [Bacteroidales bacterium]|nr:transglutaminase domain-containing protein [Bacteroidales bacterium]
MKKLFIILVFIFNLVSRVSADELSEGYKSFINNDRRQAYLHFSSASKIPETKNEALLMLSLLSTVDKDADECFRYFVDFYNSCPDRYAYTQALFRSKCVLGFNTKKSEAQLNWLQEMLKQSDLNPTLRAHVLEDLGKHYESIYNLKKSKEYFSKIGAVMEWQLAGDFENISASGFDKDYSPVTHPEPEAVFKNKINADIKWFDLYKQVDGKWVDLTYNFNCTNTLVFAQTFCKSPSDREIFLRIGTSGSLKVWINDQLLFKEEEERNNGIDTYIIPAKVAKGNNRILLQIGNSKLEQCNYMVRATDSEGNPLSDLTFSKVYTPYNKTTQEMPLPGVSFAEEFLQKKIIENPEKLVNYLVLATAYLSNDKVFDALGILQKAQTLAPNCSYIQDQLFELYLRDQDRTSASLTQEKLKMLDPDNPNVLNYLINNALNSENYKDAHRYIEKKENLYGKNIDLFGYKLRLASLENKAEEYSALLDEAYSLYPNDYDLVYDKYQFEKDYKQNQKSAVSVLKNFIKANYNKAAIMTLSEEYIQSGQAGSGVELLKQLIEYNPFNDFYYKELGMYYLKTGNYDVAQQYLGESLKIAPYYGPYYGNYARVFEEKGDKDNAIKQYENDIMYSPGDYNAIKRVRDLQSKKDVFSYFPEKDYYKIFENSPSASDYPSDHLVSLTEERQVVQYSSGGCESRIIIMLKALTLKGIDYLKEYDINYGSNEELIIEKAEVLKKNGNRLQAETNNNHIVYTSLEPGDATFLIYRRNKKITGQMSKQLYEKWMLTNWYPTINQEYDLLISKDLKLDYDLNNSSVKPEIKDVDEFKLYSWKKEQSKSIQFESYMPQMVDICELLSISTLPDWDYISKWYYDISNTKTKPDHIVTRTVNDILKGKEGLSQYQKALLFYNYIEQNIRYSSVAFRQNGTVPQKASEVLVTRIGDCKDMSVLFTSMCNVAGIKAEMVLVIRRQNGTSWMKLPSFDFDHAIAKASLDGKEYYIELTSSYLPFASLDGSLIDAVTLDISNGPEKIVPKKLEPDTRQPNNTYRDSRVSFSGDNMTYQIETKRTGSMAENTRSVYRDQSKEDQEKNFTQSLIGTYSNIKLLSLDFNPTLKDCSDTLNYTYSFVAPKVFTRINNLLLVKLPLTEQVPAYDFLLEDRKYPIEAWRYNTCDTLVEHLVVDFPENKKLVEVPQSVHFSCNQADYTLNFDVVGNKLHVNRKMVYKQNYVPVTDYSAYRNFIESVFNSDTQQIGFK